ncbi:hypothetical protein ASZ90_011208 [hydrocarbon metagenome]|uniref:Uncharacterized protein n=1 Tax=hydrocarbon metagenome TaxID=938273 RepID=A0A0W8FFL0_9ZZZZ
MLKQSHGKAALLVYHGQGQLPVNGSGARSPHDTWAPERNA